MPCANDDYLAFEMVVGPTPRESATALRLTIGGQTSFRLRTNGSNVVWEVLSYDAVADEQKIWALPSSMLVGPQYVGVFFRKQAAGTASAQGLYESSAGSDDSEFGMNNFASPDVWRQGDVVLQISGVGGSSPWRAPIHYVGISCLSRGSLLPDVFQRSPIHSGG
jgi:hypothetical protein